MELKKDALGDLALPESNKRKAFFVYLKIVFLPVLIYVLFLLGYFRVINFQVELYTIIMMGFILIVALIFARHSAEFGCHLFEQRSDEFKRELKNYIIKTLLMIGKNRKSNGNFDDFTRQYAKDVRNENFASVGSGIFPMLGILGTFLSIALSMPNFSSTNTIALESEISTLLSGVGTAFYISIYGIFLALWWMFFEKFGMSRFERLISRQRFATASFFWSKEEIEQRYMQESLGHFEKIGVIFEHVSKQEFFKELDKTVDRKFKFFTDILKVEEEAVKLSSEHIKQTMNSLLKSQRDQKDLVKVHSEILNVLHSFNQNLKDMQIKFSEQYSKLNDINDSKNLRLERSVLELDATIKKFEGNLKTFGIQLLDNQKDALEGFRLGMVDGMNAFREVFDEETKPSEVAIDELKRAVMEIDKEANEVLSRLEGENLDEKQ